MFAKFALRHFSSKNTSKNHIVDKLNRVQKNKKRIFQFDFDGLSKKKEVSLLESETQLEPRKIKDFSAKNRKKSSRSPRHLRSLERFQAAMKEMAQDVD